MIRREQVTDVTGVIADGRGHKRNKGTQSSGCLVVISLVFLRNNLRSPWD